MSDLQKLHWDGMDPLCHISPGLPSEHIEKYKKGKRRLVLNKVRKSSKHASFNSWCCSAFKVEVETPQNHHSSLDDFEKWNQQTLIPRSLLVWMNSAPSRATSSRIQQIAGWIFSLQHHFNIQRSTSPKCQEQKICEAPSCSFMSSSV